VHYGPTPAEKPSLTFRRSLYVAEDMKAGDTFNERNLRAIRPGLGLPPKFLDVLMGRKVCRDVARGTPADWDLLG
jgi:sialic acid synthase SpsE